LTDAHDVVNGRLRATSMPIVSGAPAGSGPSTFAPAEASRGEAKKRSASVLESQRETARRRPSVARRCGVPRVAQAATRPESAVSVA
jgi:hypothetical protein